MAWATLTCSPSPRPPPPFSGKFRILPKSALASGSPENMAGGSGTTGWLAKSLHLRMQDLGGRRGFQRLLLEEAVGAS